LLQQFVEEQSCRTRDRVAVVDGARAVTYGELEILANRLARHLAALGAGPERCVGLCLERSLEAVVGLLAILKAGAAYVPLDPAYPRHRLRQILADCAAELVVTRRTTWERAGLEGARPVEIDAEAAAIAARDGAPLAPAAGERNLAYVIYTSGSTGRPKGVAIEHRSAGALVRWARGRFAAGELAAVLAATSFCFDLSVFELFAPLGTGGSVVLARDVLQLPELPHASRVTLISTVPSAMAELLRAGRLPPAVQTVNLAGEPLPAALVRRIFERSAVRRVHNLYGPSEDTTYSTISTRERGDGRAPTIGLTLPGTRAYLLDSALQPVDGGGLGELHLAGEGLARGYLARPEVTAERFAPDPFSGRPGERMYRTGDLARLAPDGDLEFHGRADSQVKIRGYRIELGEIEAVLAEHPAVAGAAAAVSAGVDGDRRLLAWVEPVPGALADAGDLREHVARRLPPPMVPAVVVLLAALPRLPNGKLDRGALAAPAAGREAASLTTPYSPPRNDCEARIAALWEYLTGIYPVGIDDAFVALGGHSLLAARAAARLRDAFQVELPPHVCLAAGTVAALAAEIERRRAAGPPPGGIGRARGDGQVPLSHAQQPLWLAHRLAPESAAFNVAEAMQLRGPLALPALERALGMVVARHEALRTTVVVRDGTPFQSVAARVDVPWLRLDVTGLPAARREPAALAALRAMALGPFDLAAGPVLRAAWARLGPADHLLLVAVHHAAADGWSLDVLFRELGALYAAVSRGAEPALPELPLQYADFTLWQRRRLALPELRAAIGRWRERLAGSGPPPLDLPTDRRRPPLPSPAGRRHRLTVAAATLEPLRRLGYDAGATPFMVCLAAWQALLGRLAAQDDFAVGTPVAGRGQRQLEPLIGAFVNLLPLRSSLGGSPPSGRELIRRVREEALAAYADQEIPFEVLVDAVQPVRDPSRSPLFQAVLAFEETALDRGEWRGLEVTRQEIPTGTAKFDLTLFLRPQGGGLSGALEARRDLFDAVSGERLAERFGRLLAAMARAPEAPVEDLDFLAPAERVQLLQVPEPPSRPAPDALLPVHLQVAAMAAAFPDRLAVADPRAALSYGELDRRATRLARRLRRLGAAVDAVVGVLAERGTALVTAELAVLLAGAAYLPLDPELPDERLRLMLRLSGAALVVGQRHLLGRLGRLGEVPPAVALEDTGSFEDGATVAHAATAALAYVIFTSGSTGEPKGVGVPHRALSHLVCWHRRAYGVEPADRATLFAGISFDASVWETWPYLAAGASLHPVPEEARLAPARLLGWLAAQGITLAFLPTPVAESVLAEGPPPAALRLRALLTGGDRLVRTGASGLPFALLNHYGPTESCVVATCAEVPADDGTALPPPIGLAIDRVRVRLLDRRLDLVPPGMPGEIALAGEGLARCYLGRPDATAEAFLPDPFGGPGERLYRTGDLARLRADGQLQFLRRTDRQVKVRGLRIELGEVEACLVRHPGVRQAAAGTFTAPAGDVRLAAWLVPARPGAPASDAELRAWLGERLPAPMVPAAFVRLGALPLTPNGKLDRRALPPPDPAAATPAPDAVEAPRGVTETMLAEHWRRLLDRSAVGRADDFFLLGGHSLLAARLVARINAACGIDLPLRALFEHPTLAALALRVDAARAAARHGLPPLAAAGAAAGAVAASGAVASGGQAASGRAPLSLAQRGVWLASQLHPDSAFYNIPAVLRLAGDLDRPALAAALADLARRHAPLRTAIAERADGQPEQVIADPAPAPAPLPLVDLRRLPPGRRDRLGRDLVRETAAAPFALFRGPLLRALLLRLAGGEHVLCLSLHHLAADGWSIGVLYSDLEAAYAARHRGEPPALPPPVAQYADFARWQQHLAASGWLAPQLAYWRRVLAGAPPPLELPADRPVPARRRHRGAVVRRVVPAPLALALGRLALGRGATRQMALRAGFEMLLGRLADSRRFVAGSPVAGRRLPELEALVGIFVNVLPIPCALAGARAFDELLDGVRAAALAAYEHQDAPLELLVEELRPPRREGRNPFFETLCAGNPPLAPPRLAGLAATLEEVDTGTAKFDLSLFIDELPGGGLALSLEYDGERFDAATAERLPGHLLPLLAAAAAAPRRAWEELPLLGDAERRRLLESWGTAPAGPPPDRCLAELFEEQRAARPDAVAVVAGELALTYEGLNRRANRLAARLRRLGVGIESHVGIVAERSPELIAGLVAILKAGGAYVPLDPSLPPARLAAMAATAGVGWIVGPRHRLAAMPSGPLPVACEDAAASPATEDPPPAATPDSLAYVLFTAGSTGGPKGVAVCHRAVVSLARLAGLAGLAAPAGLSGLATAPVGLQHAPVAGGAAALEIWGPLLNGGTLVLAPPARLSPAELGGEIERHGVTFLWLPAGLFCLMVDQQLDRLRAVRQLFAGGDVLSPPHVERALAALDATVVNGYGATENATFTTCHAMRGARRFRAGVPIGRPLPGTAVRVVDAGLELLPQGRPGELLVGAGGLARGYLCRPELTAERFVPDPFAAVPGSRLFRTGDVVRWLPDGTLELLGRADRQVKVRGFRVELAEIEARLATHPRVRECAVAARTLAGDLQLVAWVVAPGVGMRLDPGELRDHLRASLPEPMLPAAFVQLTELPLSPHGKLDRAALPDPELPRAAPDMRPATPVGAIVAEVWEDVLGLAGAAGEDFFSLGGHSLKAGQLLARLRQVFGVAVPMSTFFHRPTVAGLTEALLADPVRRDQVEEIAAILAGAASAADPAAGPLVQPAAPSSR
jgi:amino acid adenylation domain-containing protein